ncbi:MAG: cache domain-containing protein, partial [Pseudomonadota bacterium]
MKQSHFTGLRARLIVLVLLAAAPALALILYSGFEMRRQAETDVLERAQQVIDHAAKTQQQMFHDTRQLLEILAQVPQVRETNAPVCSAFLAALRQQYPHYTNLGVAHRNGAIFCSALPLKEAVDISDRPYFQAAVANRDFSVGEYQIGRITGKPAINFAYPVPGRSGVTRTFLFAALDLAWLKQLAADSQLPENSSLMMIDRNGTVLLRYPEIDGWAGRSIADTNLFGAIHARADGIMQSSGLDNIERLYAFVALRDASGEPETYLSVGIPVVVAFAGANAALLRGLTGLGMVTLLTLVIAWVGSDMFILRRVSALLAAVRRVAAGDLGARADVAPRNDEIGELSRAFDHMAERLERRNARIREDGVRIDRLNRIYAVLSNINSAIIRIHERDALLREACRIAVDEGRFRLAGVSLIDSATFRLVPAHVSGNDKDMLQEIRLRLPDNTADDTHDIGAILLAGEPVVINNLAHDMRAATDRGTALRRGYRSCALLPLQTAGKLSGCLHLYADETGFFDAQEMKLLLELAAD